MRAEKIRPLPEVAFAVLSHGGCWTPCGALSTIEAWDNQGAVWPGRTTPKRQPYTRAGTGRRRVPGSPVTKTLRHET